jgi:hypothetical protein
MSLIVDIIIIIVIKQHLFPLRLSTYCLSVILNPKANEQYYIHKY